MVFLLLASAFLFRKTDRTTYGSNIFSSERPEETCGCGHPRGRQNLFSVCVLELDKSGFGERAEVSGFLSGRNDREFLGAEEELKPFDILAS